MLSDINEVTAPVGGGQLSSEVERFPGLALCWACLLLHTCVCVCTTHSSFLSSNESCNIKSCSGGCSILHPREAMCGEGCIPTYWKVKFSTGRHFVLPFWASAGGLGGWLVRPPWSTRAKSVKSQYPHLWDGFQGGRKRRPVGQWLFFFFFFKALAW